jgi:non-ribosomal peptide synthetase component E (peptide arylation enzyme)
MSSPDHVGNFIDGVVYASAQATRDWLESGAWDRRTAGQLLREAAQRHPEKIALAFGGRTITFAQLDSVTDRLGAALLSHGAQPGDRALFQMANSTGLVLALIACFKAGIIPVCTLPQFRELEISQIGDISQAKLYFVQDGLGEFDLVAFAAAMMQKLPECRMLITSEKAKPLPGLRMEDLIDGMPDAQAKALLASVTIGPADVISFQLSGGTTGVPKIIPRFHGEYIAQSRAWVETMGKTHDATGLWNLPLIHNAGSQWALMPMLIFAQTMVLQARPDMPEMFGAIEKYRVTHAFSIGPVAAAVLGYAQLASHDCSSLRFFNSLARADALEAHLHIPCANVFGLTEGLLLATPPDASSAERHGSCGGAVTPFDEIRLFHPGTEEEVPLGEIGELCFRGPYTLKGYYRAPEATAQALSPSGFFRSGDLLRAQASPSGRRVYAFEGRTKDNIDRGGEKFSAGEVEMLIAKHPDIADVAVVAMPDPVYGERACAFVVLRPGAQAPGVEELGAYLSASGLAKFKQPERIEVLDALPVTRAGKLDKPALRAMIAAKQ